MPDNEITQEGNNGVASLKELWENISKMARGRVEDNQKTIEANAPYPLSVRRAQIADLKRMIEAIEDHHQRLGDVSYLPS